VGLGGLMGLGFFCHPYIYVNDYDIIFFFPYITLIQYVAH
jgi:hypothetical protein